MGLRYWELRSHFLLPREPCQTETDLATQPSRLMRSPKPIMAMAIGQISYLHSMKGVKTFKNELKFRLLNFSVATLIPELKPAYSNN